MNNLVIKDIKFSSQKNNYGHKYVNMYNMKDTIKLQIPKMNLPFGVKEYNNKFVLDLLFNENKKCKEFYNKLKELDEYIQEYAKENMKEWFQTKKVKPIYKSCIKESEKYGTLLKVKLTQDKNSEFKCLIFNDKKEKINISKIEDVLEKRVNVKGIIECCGVWFMDIDEDIMYGITWKCNQILIHSKDEDICFVDDSDVNSEEFIESEEEMDE